MLHFAPELVFERKFRQVESLDYLTADLLEPNAMVKMDITDIQYPDQSFDVIYCSHVLEHVADDRKGMRELRRVMSRDGWGLFQVPICLDRTLEDASVTDPKEREPLFGQHDHVRKYGVDFADRLRDAGFSVEVITAGNLLSSEEIVQYATKGEQVFYCT